MKKYWITTYGCQMNKSDSERIASILENQGYKEASNINEASLLVVNMCSVRQSAVDRVFGLSQKLSKLKAQKSKVKTVLTGCVLRKDKRKFREIFDSIWNMRNYFEIPPKCQNKILAYVPISTGCNNFCSYCVVPFTRGSLVCRNHQEILEEIKNVAHPVRESKEIDYSNETGFSNGAQKGFKEIWLLGQNVNNYQSPTDSSINFAKLLKMVNDIPGKFRVRFISPHPGDFSDELIETMAKCQKVTPCLNLPVQSGDNKILKKMNRNYTVKKYKNLVRKIRKKIPEIKLSTDVIVGFPGETEKRFQNTIKLFKEIKFDYAYIAKYSPRPGTAAFLMKDNISREEKKRREKILREIINTRC